MVVIWRESDLQDLLFVKLQPLLENRIFTNRKYQKTQDLFFTSRLSLRSDRDVHVTNLIRQTLILRSICKVRGFPRFYSLWHLSFLQYFPLFQDTRHFCCSMAPSLDNLGSFYRGKMEQATGVQESLDYKVVSYVLLTFTVVGFLAVFSRLALLARLFFSLFVLPGKPVCSLPHSNSNS